MFQEDVSFPLMIDGFLSQLDKHVTSKVAQVALLIQQQFAMHVCYVSNKTHGILGGQNKSHALLKIEQLP